MDKEDVEKFHREVMQEFKDYLKADRMKQKENMSNEKIQLEDEQLKQLVREGEEE